VAALRGIEGAQEEDAAATTIWTMPGFVAQSSGLTASTARMVAQARASVTCSTFNFQKTSALWPALGEAAKRPGVAVRVYLDTEVADPGWLIMLPDT
jgi:hypothetical protein